MAPKNQRKFLIVVFLFLSIVALAQEYRVNPMTGRLDLVAALNWRVVGQGTLAARPATCVANKDAYICNGAGCTSGKNVHYCTATDTWTEQGGTGGSGTVTNVATTTPITGGPITTTGTIACATCALTSTTVTAGAGLGGGGDLSANRTFATASGEADFLAAGALTCGASTQGKAQVHTTPLQYCDNAATPALQYAAYGDSAGKATAGDSAASFFSTGILEPAVGGTGNGFTLFSGPATTEKTFTLPNASATILTTNAAVTIGQGGTGTGSTLTGLVRGSASAFTAAELSGDVTTSGSNAATVKDNLKISTLGITIDGGGSAITTGVKGYLEVTFACTINRATTLADQSGSIVIDVWKDTYANYPPTVADTITASAKPTITTATKAQDSTLTGWTTAVTAGDILGFNVDSATTVTRVHLSLRCTRT